jgi:signal transduction histidine kinase
MWDTAGRAIGICGLNRDVTERRRVREQLEQANLVLAERQRDLMAALANIEHDHEQLRNFQLKLVQSEKMESIGRLAAGVAHEVKNPLATIMMALEYLTRCDHKTTDLSPVLQTMARAARRADSVVRGLMDFAAPGTMRLAAASPAELVRNSIQMVRHELTRAHVQCQTDVPATIPAALIDVGKIEQVLVNLFMNAIQAMPKGGTLSVRAESGVATDCLNDGRSRHAGLFQPEDHIVIIEIEDTGSGIPEEHIPRLFEPFFTTKPKGQGNGLGLTVIKTIMDLHGGGIDIRNRAGGGVQATLMLKAAAPGKAC